MCHCAKALFLVKFSPWILLRTYGAFSVIRVDVIYDNDQVRLQLLRANLIAAYTRLELPPHWHEWSSKDKKSPYYIKGYPPLTVFINGAPLKLPRTGLRGSLTTPSAEQLEKAFTERNTWLSFRPSKRGRYLFILATLPFFMLMLIPSLDCPLCWPGYSHEEGYTNIDMLGIRNFTAYLFPVILIALALSLVSFIYRSILKNNYQPFLLVACAAISILSSKVISFDPAMEYGGLILYITAVIWHFVDSSHLEFRDCPSCNALRITKKN